MILRWTSEGSPEIETITKTEEEERPSKRNRTELLDAYFMAVEKIIGKNRKEIVFNQLSKENKKKFDQAILKEIRNNLQSGAYEALTREESEEIRRTSRSLAMSLPRNL